MDNAEQNRKLALYIYEFVECYMHGDTTLQCTSLFASVTWKILILLKCEHSTFNKSYENLFIKTIQL